VASETIPNGQFYARFFDLVERYLDDSSVNTATGSGANPAANTSPNTAANSAAIDEAVLLNSTKINNTENKSQISAIASKTETNAEHLSDPKTEQK